MRRLINASFIVIFVIAEYLLKNSAFNKSLIRMKAKLKKLALMLTMIIILLNLSPPNMKIVLSENSNGKIDLFTQKEPYSGKGPNTLSDAFGPGEEVQIYALATYNEEPVQNILVAFEIIGPKNPVENVTFFRSALTNENGIATIRFRISYLNEITFGEWMVIGNAQISEFIVQDTVKFKVGWIVKILSVKTINETYMEQESFSKGSFVGIELTLQNIALTEKSGVLTITIYDHLNIPVNMTQLSDFVIPPNSTLVLPCFLYLPKNAHVGEAIVYACVYTALPEFGGVLYSPEVSKNFLISELRYFLTVKTEPIGVITIIGEGWYEENTNVTLTAPSEVSISNGVRYKFSYWDVDGNSQDVGVNSINVFMNANHTATAHYILQYYLTVKTDPSEIATIPGEGWYNAFTNVTLNATTIYEYEFSYWDVDGISQGEGVNPIVIYMNAPHNATAHYTMITAPAGWFVPDWFWWLLPLLILIILLLFIWLYGRRRRKKAEEAFHSGWTAWYYCYDLRKTRKI